MKKFMFSAALLLAAGTVSAQYVHIEMKDGTKYDFESKTIKTMTVDTQAPKPAAPQAGDKVEGTVTIGKETYTKTVGGTVGKAVDLGLPSGTLWASHNIGATKPEEYGAYLAWAEVGAAEEGYVDGMKYNKEGEPYYNWNNLKYSEGTSYKGPFSKYLATSSVDNEDVLEAIDDAATVNWGDGWRMPTFEEHKELRTECTWTWVITDVKDANGDYIKGYKVVGSNGNSIFLPAAGYCDDNSLDQVGSYGYYWLSSLHTSGSNYAFGLYFYSSRVSSISRDRIWGHSVRPVRSE